MAAQGLLARPREDRALGADPGLLSDLTANNFRELRGCQTPLNRSASLRLMGRGGSRRVVGRIPETSTNSGSASVGTSPNNSTCIAMRRHLPVEASDAG